MTLGDSGVVMLDSAKNGTFTKNGASTSNGDENMIQLTDGTKAWLNADSSVQYPTASDRKDRSKVFKYQ